MGRASVFATVSSSDSTCDASLFLRESGAALLPPAALGDPTGLDMVVAAAVAAVVAVAVAVVFAFA